MLGGGIVSATVVPKAKVKLKYVAKLKLNLGLGIFFGRRSKEDGGNKRDFFKNVLKQIHDSFSTRKLQ